MVLLGVHVLYKCQYINTLQLNYGIFGSYGAICTLYHWRVHLYPKIELNVTEYNSYFPILFTKQGTKCR